jgi:PKD repeat protein
MAADNDLESEAINDLNEMEVIGSTSDVNIIVQLDRSKDHDSSNENWQTTKRFYVTSDTDKDVINSEELADLGELDMSRKQTFKDFVGWAVTDYPAEHYVLILWDHGEGLTRAESGEDPMGTRRGFCKDTPGGSLQIWDLEQAFAELRAEGTFTEKIDVIGFDICYGGFWEFAYQLREYVDYYVGSFDEVPFPGWDYALPLSDLKSAPDTISPKVWSEKVVQYYYNTYDDLRAPYLTIAAVDVQVFISDLLPAINEFAYQLSLGSYYYINQYAKARLATDDTWGQTPQASKKYADLYHFCENLQAQDGIPLVIENAARGVMDNYTKAVLAHKHQINDESHHLDNHGPGIYFPRRDGSKTVNKEYYDYGLGETVWGDFLKFFMNPMAIDFRPIKDSEDAGYTPTISVNVTSGVSISGVFIHTDKSADKITAAKVGSTIYDAILPAQPMNTVVRYYVQVKDSNDVYYYSPPGSHHLSEQFALTYKIGADTTPPVIQHIPQVSYQAKGGDVSIFAKITDNLGIDDSTAKLNYRVMQVGRDDPFSTVTMTKVGDTDGKWKVIFGESEDPADIYVGKVPQQPLGTILEYYFEVSDSSTAKNQARLPKIGVFELSIIGSVGPIMFDSYYGSMTGYQGLMDLADEKGYDSVELTSALEMGDLAQGKVLIVVQPTKAITGDELNELKSFLGSGGDLMVIGSSSSVDNANSFINLSGLNFEAFASSAHTITNPLPHELMEDVTSVKLGASTAAINTQEATVSTEILRSNADALVLANSSWGDGKVLAVSDEFLDDTNLDQECNKCLAGNILYWLSQNLAPVAEISGPDLVATNSSFTLNAGSSHDPDGDVMDYTWDMGDSSLPKYTKSVDHTYSKKGVYKVKLIVRDAEGAVGITTKTITVNSGPVALFEVLTSSLITNSDIKFKSTSYDTDGFIYSTYWDFGDGNTSLNTSPTHQYEMADVYTVSLWVVDDMGLNDTFSMKVRLIPEIDDIVIKITTEAGVFTSTYSGGNLSLVDEDGNNVDLMINITEEETVTLELMGFTSKQPVNYSWNFGDMSPPKMGKEVGHSYYNQGIYSVFVFLRNSDGATGNSWVYFNVKNVIPNPKIEIVKRDGKSVTFNAGDDIDTPNDVLIFKWDFGDGTTLNTTERKVTHNYTYTGKFTISVSVFDDEGAFGRDDTELEIVDRDYTFLSLIAIFAITSILIAVFIILLTLVIKKEEKPKVGQWPEWDPYVRYYEIGAAAALVLGFLVFGMGMVYIISLSGDLGDSGILFGRVLVGTITLIVSILSVLYILIRNKNKGHTYITKQPIRKCIKKVEAALRSARVEFMKAEEKETIYTFGRFDVKLRLIRVLGNANEDIGTMLVLSGRDFIIIEKLKEAISKKKL